MPYFGNLSLPHGSSDLTASPTQDFSDENEWIQLASMQTTCGPDAFWFAINIFTRKHHWNKTIFQIDILDEESFPISTTHLHQQTSHGAFAPKPGQRYNALRKLYRKTPAPIGGDDGKSPTYSAREWTSQYVDETRHTAVFGLVIPSNVQTEQNKRALRYWPFQYPKVKCYRFTYEAIADAVGDVAANDSQPVKRGLLKYAVIPLGEDPGSLRNFDTLVKHSAKAAHKMLTQVRKRAEHFDPQLGDTTYVKRVVHDNLITEQQYRKHYDVMKVKYNFWVEQWTECTDPVKFVYEELSIAAYLCALWEKEREEEQMEAKQTFIDCGAGNGFLTYLLISEGHDGIGVDLQKRDIWNQYPENVTAALHHMQMDPRTYDCSKYDWIIGNHSDELSPWIPLMAARCQRQARRRRECLLDGASIDGDAKERVRRRAHPRFFVLPCCFYDFDGKKIAFGNTRRTLGVRVTADTGKYEQYYRWIAQIARAFGFTVEYENLRIPSTKYVSLLGRFIEHEERIASDVIDEMTSLMLLDAKLSHG